MFFSFFLLLFLLGALLPGGYRDEVKGILPFGRDMIEPVCHFSLPLLICLCGIIYWPRYVWRVCLSVLLIGGSVEILQFYVPRRDPALDDFALDSLGVFSGWLLWHFFVRRLKKTLH